MSVKVGAGAGFWDRRLSFCALGVTVVQSRWRWVRQPLQGQPREGRGKQALTGAQVHFLRPVTNGWRRLHLSTSTGDSRLPQPLRYLALGVWGAGFC